MLRLSSIVSMVCKFSSKWFCVLSLFSSSVLTPRFVEIIKLASFKLIQTIATPNDIYARSQNGFTIADY
jgi:hypothetical protein